MSNFNFQSVQITKNSKNQMSTFKRLGSSDVHDGNRNPIRSKPLEPVHDSSFNNTTVYNTRQNDAEKKEDKICMKQHPEAKVKGILKTKRVVTERKTVRWKIEPEKIREFTIVKKNRQSRRCGKVSGRNCYK